MPVNIFKYEMEKQMDANYNYGIMTTGKKVAERMIKHYVKPKRDQEQ